MRRRWNYERVMEDAHLRPDLNFSYVEPEDVENNKSKLPIECVTCGYQWYPSIHSIFSPSTMTGCPSCSGKMKWTYSRLERYICKHRPEINISQICDDDVENHKSKLSLSCNNCEYEWMTSLNSIVNCNSGCPSCAGNAPWTYSRFKAYMRKYRPEINISQICEDDVENNKSQLSFSCNDCDYEWMSSLASVIINNTGCARCSGNEKWTFSRFKAYMRKYRPEINISQICEEDVVNKKSRLTFSCNNCYHEWMTSLHNIVNGETGCSRCAGKEAITYDVFLERIHTRPDIDFSLTKERYIDNGSESRLKCRCVECQHIWRPSSHSIFNHNSGCPACRASRGEKAVKKYLEEHNITYEREFILESLPRKRFDFRFEHKEIGYLLEFDGIQHFKETKHFHREENSFEKGQRVDRRKTRHALRNGYRLIRIDYTQVDNVHRHIRRALRSEENLYLSSSEMYSYLS